MTTNMPAALDALTNPTGGNFLNSPSHSSQHDNANDAIEAIEKIVVGPIFINVKGYGAKGDGTTDDTAALAAAFAAAAVTGAQKRVIFPAGVYPTTASITVPPQVGIWAPAGNQTVIKATAAMAQVLFFNDLAGAQLGGITEGIAVDGNNLAAIGIHVQVCTDRSFRSCYVTRCTDTGWLVNATQNAVFELCRADTCGTAGVAKSSGWRVNNGAGGNVFIRCQATGCQPHMLVIGHNTTWDALPSGIPGGFYISYGPTDNQWYSGEFEAMVAGTTSLVYMTSGFDNHFTGVAIESTPAVGHTVILVEMDHLDDNVSTRAGFIGFHECQFGESNNTTGNTTVFKARKFTETTLENCAIGAIYQVFNLDDVSPINWGYGNTIFSGTGPFMTTTGTATINQLVRTNLYQAILANNQVSVGGHLDSFQGQGVALPSIVAGVAMGAGALVQVPTDATVASNDTRMILNLVMGSSAVTSGVLCSVTYGTPRQNAYANVMLMPCTAGFWDLKPHVVQHQDGFDIVVEVAPAAGSFHQIMATVIG